jgi:hypothetical protein
MRSHTQTNATLLSNAALVPALAVLSRAQAQGDLLIVPADAPEGLHWQRVPAQGALLVDGGARANSHVLHSGSGSPDVRWAEVSDGNIIAYLQIPEQQSAYLVHTEEHAALGVGRGTFAIRRKALISLHDQDEEEKEEALALSDD